MLQVAIHIFHSATPQITLDWSVVLVDVRIWVDLDAAHPPLPRHPAKQRSPHDQQVGGFETIDDDVLKDGRADRATGRSK
jgi:hypothetical protein